MQLMLPFVVGCRPDADGQWPSPRNDCRRADQSAWLVSPRQRIQAQLCQNRTIVPSIGPEGWRCDGQLHRALAGGCSRQPVKRRGPVLPTLPAVMTHGASPLGKGVRHD